MEVECGDVPVTAMSASEMLAAGLSPGSMSSVKLTGGMTGGIMSIPANTEYKVVLGTYK